MTIDEFAAVTAERIPTPGEFVGFVRGFGWDFQVDGDRAAICKVKKADMTLAQATAAMLRREPYRTNVLELLRQQPVSESPPSDRQTATYALERMAGECSAPATERPTTATPEVCHSCRATVFTPGPEIAAVCPTTPCPYFRLRR